MHSSEYRSRVAAEARIYDHCLNAEDQPAIFHYWSNRYIRPMLTPFGFDSPNAMFKRYLANQCELAREAPKRFVSIGSGNCNLEVELALHLRSSGYADFVIDCLDLNAAMLERGRAAASLHCIAGNIGLIQADFNEWEPARDYDAVIANQALHHVLRLEDLFTRVRGCLKPHGRFLVSDMIGRNGHRLWPEALAVVQEFWPRLPPSHRFNHQLNRYEELYDDWDYSQDGFEAIRSQDILPLLIQRFHFELFIAFGNAIHPFVERSFGRNFDSDDEWDRVFIDEVHERDHREILDGRLKPAHMLAVLGKGDGLALSFTEPLKPEYCVRPPDAAADSRLPAINTRDAYIWHSWPHSAQSELELACRRLGGTEGRVRDAEKRLQKAQRQIEQRTAWGLDLDAQLENRTAWAIRLDHALKESSASVLRLERELKERAAWALDLDRQLEERSALVRDLTSQVEERTTWALRLNKQLEERTAWALGMQKELEERKGWAFQLQAGLVPSQWAVTLARFPRRIANWLRKRLHRSE